jgi:RNA polymerase sigma-70 factor (ECF subfamily)
MFALLESGIWIQAASFFEFSRPQEVGRPMAPPNNWQLERYRALLSLRARQLHLDPRLKRRFDSSDLVQETLLKAHKNLHQFRGSTEAELVKWLQEILANALADQIRKAKTGKRNVSLEKSLETIVAESSSRLEAYLAADQSSPSQQVQRKELLLRAAEALESLPEDQRDVVMLRDLMNQPVAQIAQQLGRTEKSVAGLLLRGRHKLRELLEAYQ